MKFVWQISYLPANGASPVIISCQKFKMYPPESEVSRELADLTERKNQHTLVHGVNIAVLYIPHLIPL